MLSQDQVILSLTLGIVRISSSVVEAGSSAQASQSIQRAYPTPPIIDSAPAAV